ncbi:TPA: EscU/YscU/HrcU family type III secretion system export apparatus switch protein, partial [Escherichia coli]|nr:EscU/YscU/HrcU family type III secretion system export apparatus switch protein [Escherichia coli]
MDKQEVKREYKEQEGNSEIKSKRRERIRKFFLSN